MKNLLFGSLVIMSLIAFTGCTGADSTSDAKSAKCGEGKCGADKKAEKAMKCGEGKCGGDKK